MTSLRLTLLAFVTAAVLFAAASFAADKDTDQAVNLELKDIPVKQAIEKLFESTGLKYKIEPGVTGKVVELKLKGVTLKQALDALCEAAELTYTVSDGLYVIKPAPPKEGSKQPVKRTVQSGTSQMEPQATPEQSEPAESASQPENQRQPLVPQQNPPNQVIVTQNADNPVYYGQPPGPGYFGWSPYYAPPYFQIGGVRYMGRAWWPYVIGGGPPTVMTYETPPPPPPGYVNPELQRFLQTQYATRPRVFFWPAY